MSDQQPPRRQPSASRLPRVIEKDGREKRTSLPVAPPVARKQTPIGMPAPPANAPDSDRQSHDDLDHVLEIERLERQRAQLLAKTQDLEQENRLLRETAPTVIFPPPSVPPSDPKPAPKPKVEVASDPPSKRYALSHRLTQLATGLGIFVAIAWNAFNSYRSAPEKVEALDAQARQGKRQREEEAVARALADKRNLAALRALHCYAKQLRGASARQGLDLPSLPPGGVKALRLADDDPNRPGPPKFVAEEVCPEFPQLPPDISTN